MAEILPLKAWRYNPELLKNLDQLISPLFDVVSDEQRNLLYKNSFNSIHISVPLGINPPKEAAKTLDAWKQNKVIIQDEVPGIYVYYQYFKVPGDDKEYCRKGFICNIKAYEWEEQVILRHENTIPSSVNDRIEILKSTLLNVSPTHGLYADPTFELEKYMDESMRNPIKEFKDYQGVRDVLSVIHDRKVILKFIERLKNEKIILADGHHRYESSLILKNKLKTSSSTGHEPYNYHLMYLTNMESDDIKILPTHRLIVDLAEFEEESFIQQLNLYFHVQFIEKNHSRIEHNIQGQPWMFGIILKKYTLMIQLKHEAIGEISWNFPEKIKTLDLTVLHYFIVEKILGIPGRQQRKSENIKFERNTDLCVKLVEQGEANLAVLTNPVSLKEVKEVCYSGFTLPQKSTYFYPKVICGFLYSSIKENEFTSFNSCF